MRKDDNNWEIDGKVFPIREDDYEYEQTVRINGEVYIVPVSIACLSHSILLLVDAINDKKCF